MISKTPSSRYSGRGRRYSVCSTVSLFDRLWNVCTCEDIDSVVSQEDFLGSEESLEESRTHVLVSSERGVMRSVG